jgi:hypothetical protein
MVNYEWGNWTSFGTFLELRHCEVIRRIHLSTSFGDVGAAHHCRGPKRKVRTFEPSRGSDTPLTRSLKNP